MASLVLEKPRIWTPAVSRALELPEKLTVSEWADRSRVLGPENAEPGQWYTDRTPYLRGIMDAFTDAHVEDISIMASTQVGKTESMLNMLGYAVDQDPGPALFVLPTKPDARSFSYKRISPMVMLSPDLFRHMTEKSDDFSKMEMTLDRMTIYMAGSESPSALASRPIRYVFFDETDKYPPFAGREADPIKLGTERTRTFKVNRKRVKCSTPTTEFGYINREYEQSDMRKYYVPCPHCGKMQVLVWSQVKFPKDVRDPEAILMHRMAWYECIQCKGKIVDSMKQKMLLHGKWVPERFKDNVEDGPLEYPSQKHAGFWINAIYSPWLTLSEIVAEWLKCKDDKALLMNFVNSWLAEVWRDNVSKTSTSEISRLALDRDPGIVPAKGLVLTAGVDVQKDHFVCVIRAWGYLQESWLVKAQRLESWEDVIDVLFKTIYTSEDGRELQVRLSCIDSGYLPDEVYEVCRAWPGMSVPTKGRDHLQGEAFRPKRIETFASGKPIPGGLLLYHLDTSYFKDKIFRLIKGTQEGVDGGWHLHRDPSEDYQKQICAESKVPVVDKRTRKTTWEWRLVSSHAANHFLDAEVMAAAAAEILRVFSLRPEQEKSPQRSEPESERGSWLGGRSWVSATDNWLER